MPVAESPHSIRISSAAAARSGRGAFGGDERVVYWKCEHNESFTEDLYIPLVNEARENALGEYMKMILVSLWLSFLSRLYFDWLVLPFFLFQAIAAQQRMSERELQRRKLTGTLASCSVTASVAALGLGGDKFLHPGDTNTKTDLEKAVTEFQTELSSKFFQAPSQVIIPASISRKSGKLTSSRASSLCWKLITLSYSWILLITHMIRDWSALHSFLLTLLASLSLSLLLSALLLEKTSVCMQLATTFW